MKPEGWAWHDPRLVWHYYVARRSLCGRFVFHGDARELHEHGSNLGQTGAPYAGPCGACWDRAEKRNVKPESLPLFRGGRAG